MIIFLNMTRARLRFDQALPCSGTANEILDGHNMRLWHGQYFLMTRVCGATNDFS